MRHRHPHPRRTTIRRKSRGFLASYMIAALSLLLIGGSVAAAYNPQDPNDQNRSVQFERHAFIDISAKWATPQIAVCWENPSTRFNNEMEMVRSAVASTWQAASQLRFTGWQRCVSNNRGIRIQIDDSGPHTKGLGNRLNGVRNGMVLNFTFNNWGQSCQSTRDYCIETIAVHEFGHAIAFAHEQNRADAPGECQQLRQGSDGTVLLTPYDPDSVMNYCNPVYNNDGKLSRYDTEAVVALYGSADVNASRPFNAALSPTRSINSAGVPLCPCADKPAGKTTSRRSRKAKH